MNTMLRTDPTINRNFMVVVLDLHIGLLDHKVTRSLHFSSRKTDPPSAQISSMTFDPSERSYVNIALKERARLDPGLS